MGTTVYQTINDISIPVYKNTEDYFSLRQKYNFLSEDYEEEIRRFKGNDTETYLKSVYGEIDYKKLKVDKDFVNNKPITKQYLNISDLSKNGFSYLFPMEISIRFRVFELQELQESEESQNYYQNFQYDPEVIKNIFESNKHSEYTIPIDLQNTLYSYSHTDYKQILGYKITKAKKDKIIETFFINTCNVKDKNLLSYVDTKVKYNVDYTYQIYTIVLFVKNNTWYIQDFPISEKLTTRIVDYPPLPPQVEIHSILENSNNINIFLNTESGQVTGSFININTNGKLIQNSQGEKKNWQIKSDPETFLFKSDQKNKKYVIIKTINEPYSYDDFFTDPDSVIEYLDDYVDSKTDTIQKNTKYYYTFFCLDYHNHISNPSDVYTVILNDEGGFIYPEIGVHKFKDDDSNLKKDIRYFGNNIKISPQVWHTNTSRSKIQSITDPTKLANMVPGVVEPSLWGNNFKFRVTSVSTGKKLDIDFTYVINKK